MARPGSDSSGERERPGEQPSGGFDVRRVEAEQRRILAEQLGVDDILARTKLYREKARADVRRVQALPVETDPPGRRLVDHRYGMSSNRRMTVLSVDAQDEQLYSATAQPPGRLTGEKLGQLLEEMMKKHERFFMEDGITCGKLARSLEPGGGDPLTAWSLPPGEGQQRHGLLFSRSLSDDGLRAVPGSVSRTFTTEGIQGMALTLQRYYDDRELEGRQVIVLKDKTGTAFIGQEKENNRVFVLQYSGDRPIPTLYTAPVGMFLPRSSTLVSYYSISGELRVTTTFVDADGNRIQHQYARSISSGDYSKSVLERDDLASDDVLSQSTLEKFEL